MMWWNQNHPQINCHWKTVLCSWLKSDSLPQTTCVRCLCEGERIKYEKCDIMLIPSHKILFESIIFSLGNNNKFAIRSLNTHTSHTMYLIRQGREKKMRRTESGDQMHIVAMKRDASIHSISSEFKYEQKHRYMRVSHWPDDYTMCAQRSFAVPKRREKFELLMVETKRIRNLRQRKRSKMKNWMRQR